MTQIGNLLLEQLTFERFELEPGLFQFLEHDIHPLKMAGWIFQKDDNII